MTQTHFAESFFASLGEVERIVGEELHVPPAADVAADARPLLEDGDTMPSSHSTKSHFQTDWASTEQGDVQFLHRRGADVHGSCENLGSAEQKNSRDHDPSVYRPVHMFHRP